VTRILALALAIAACVVMPSISAHADPCLHTTQTSTGTGTGMWLVHANDYQQEGCDPDTTEAMSPQGHLVVDPNPVCTLGGAVLCQDEATCGDGGRLHAAQWVPVDGDPEPVSPVCVGSEQPPAPPQVTGVRVLQAFRQIPLPTPTLGTSPPDQVTLVNLPTIFYTEAAPFDRQVRVLGRRVALHIEPVSYDWSVGQGVRFTTDWAGSPYQHGVTPQQDPDAYVTWSYTHAEKGVPARVEVVWGATWSLDGKPMGRVPGTVSMTSPPTSLTVREARGVLTGE